MLGDITAIGYYVNTIINYQAAHNVITWLAPPALTLLHSGPRSLQQPGVPPALGVSPHCQQGNSNADCCTLDEGNWIS